MSGPTELDVDALAQEIRRVDGNNSLGAGALAEALLPFLSALPASGAGWRDMESAPKDASEIIYTNKFGEIGYCYWSEAGGPFDQSMWWDELADDECCPVGWLPRSALPAAPDRRAGE